MNRKSLILVVGSNGFIGKSIIKNLKNNSLATKNISRKECDLLDSYQTIKYFRSFREKTLDVIFVASITRSKEDSFSSMQKNIIMIKNFIDASKNLKLNSLIFISSVDVYDYKENTQLTEESFLFPSNPYAISKICSEEMLKSAFKENILTILRLPGAYGPNDQFQSIVGGFINSINRKEVITLKNQGRQLRDYVFVNDIGDIILELLKKPQEGIFNLSTGSSLELISIINLISKFLDKESIIEGSLEKSKEYNLRISNKKLADIFSNFSFTSMELGIKKYIQGINSNEKK
jgi:nucleoside-diphosphate-sugar epimerase